MARDEHHPDHTNKRLDAAQEGDRGPTTTKKVAGEAIADEPQAQPTKKFTTFSGTDDKKLTKHDDAKLGGAAPVSEFVIEDKAGGIEYTANGARPPAPRQSFLDGLKKIFDGAASEEEAAQLQSKFSIEYMLNKAKDFVANPFGAQTTQLDGDASSDGARGQLIAHKDGQADNSIEFLQNKMRAEQAEATVADTAAQKPHLNDEALQVAAKTLHDAANANVFGVPVVDAKTVLNTLDPLNSADRERIMAIYRHEYKTEFQADVAGRMLPQDSLQLQALLHRDGTSHADDLGSIERSLDTLNFSKTLSDTTGTLGYAQFAPLPSNIKDVSSVGQMVAGFNAVANQSFAERQLRETLGTLHPKDLGALFNSYANAHPGEPSLASTLLNNPNISQATRDALAIYIKKGANLDQADVRNLAEIGLNYGNADIFNEAFVNTANPAVEAVRKEYSTPAKQLEMKQKFGDSGAEIASDYVRDGGISTATLIHGDTHFYGSNKEHIAFAVEHISDAERQEFIKGMQAELAKAPGDTTAPSPNSTFSRIHEALQAAGTAREVAMWEAQITRGSGSLISQLAALHDDGIPVFNTGLRINEHHDTNRMLQAVNNISEHDWNAIHQDPLYRKQLDLALNTFLKDGSLEDQSLRYFIDTKLNAKSFEESKLVTPESLGIRFQKPEAESAQPKMDLPPEARPCDVLKAFIDGTHNVTVEDVRRLLNDPTMNLGETKSEFAHKYQQDLDAKLLGKVDPLDRLEILRLLSPEHNARADFYGARFDAKDHSSAIGDPLMTGLSNSSAVQREDHLNKIYGYIQANGSDVDRLSVEKQEQLEKLFWSGSDISHQYSMQNHEFTSQFTDASIGVAAGVAAPFTAGGSWELYVTLMAVGGTYKAAMRPLLEGGNYQANPMTAGKDIFTGGMSTLVAVLGPEMLGINKLAASSTAGFLLKENAELLAQGVTKQQLERELVKASENILAHGAKSAPGIAEKEFAELAKKYAAPGCEEKLAQLMNKTLAENTLPLARNALTRALYERGLVMAAGGAGGGLNEVSTHIFDKDHKDLAKQAIQGILIGAVSAGILDTVFHGAVKVVKATRGRFAGEEVVEVQSENLKFQTRDGETFHEPNSNVDIKGDLQVTDDGQAVIVDHTTGKMHRVEAGEPVERVAPVERVEAPDYQLGLENEPALHIINLKREQQLMYQGKEWKVLAFNNEIVSLGELRVESFDRKALMSKLGRSESFISDLREGSNMWDSQDRQYKIVRIDGRPPNETFVVSSVKEERTVSISELKTEHPEIVSATPKQLLGSHGDPEIAALGRGEITLGERIQTDPDKKLLWYHATCRDPVTNTSYDVVFRANLSAEDTARMQKEVLAQSLFKQMGFDNGYPPSAIRKLNIEGHEVLGFVQKWEGEPVQKGLPKLIETKLYPHQAVGGEAAFVPCREELELIMKPSSDPHALLKSLSERAAHDPSLNAALDRFQGLVADPARLNAVRNDRDFAQFRSAMEQAIIERNVLGDFDDHADNFMIITDASGHLKTVRNLDVAYALDDAAVPYFVQRRKDWVTNDIYATLNEAPISQASLAKLSKFVDNPETPNQLKAQGFSPGQIDKIMARARYFVEHKKFGKVTNVRTQ
ncbi:MAG: hypothetical protein U0105_21845 [Candidatus Obscuribacterales bacterium]